MRELENWMETSFAQVKVLKSKIIFSGRCHLFRYDQALHENFGECMHEEKSLVFISNASTKGITNPSITTVILL